MTAEREREVTQAFVRIASSLATGYDVADLLTTLTTDCARLLDVASAGVMLADEQGVLHLLAASSQRTRDLEVLQLQRAEGPCLDCYGSGEPVLVPDVARAAARWPLFAAAAQAAGFASVTALPLRFGGDTLGALGLFGDEVAVLSEEDLSLGQALADVGTVALVQDHASARRAAVADRLRSALSTRVVLEQAKGVVAQRGGVDMVQAFDLLRRYATAHSQRLTAVARGVVERSIDPDDVLGPTPSPRTTLV